LGYATSCTATRSIMLVDAQDWISRAAQYLAELVVDDPLDPATQVGYIDPGCLDYLSDLVTKNRLRINTYGGTRLSPVQSTPLLVASQEEVPDFFGQEIPAYVLAIRECSDLSEAVDEVNRYAGVDIDRLAVSLFHLPSDQRLATANRIKAHIVLVDLPTTTLLPFIHEGNDYALTLTRSRLLINVV
jgi:acyl-CoA reductase-like NAD-dependent aldehyde dehydrogenase